MKTSPIFRRTGILAVIALVLLSVPAVLLSLHASADDQANDSAVRFYFTVPFVPAAEKTAPRLGFQILTDVDDETDYRPVPHELGMYTTLDLGFTLDGLAKLDIAGNDMRGVYEKFARSIGLTPDEVELCRESDCLDWVKPDETMVAPQQRLVSE